MNRLNALCDLPECHRFSAGHFDRRREHRFRQGEWASAFMAYQQAAHAEFAPGVRPVVYGLAAHFEFARNVLHLQSACTQQQPGCPDAEIAMTVVQRQLLQGVPLNISQFYVALHQQAQCGDACEVNKNQTRLLATLIEAIRSAGATVEQIICVAEKVEYAGVERVRKATGLEVKTLVRVQVTGDTSSVVNVAY
jgi:hypothetical protein